MSMIIVEQCTVGLLPVHLGPNRFHTNLFPPDRVIGRSWGSVGHHLNISSASLREQTSLFGSVEKHRHGEVLLYMAKLES